MAQPQDPTPAAQAHAGLLIEDVTLLRSDEIRYIIDNPGYLQQRRIFNRLESAADQLNYLQQLTGNHPYQHNPDKEIAA